MKFLFAKLMFYPNYINFKKYFKINLVIKAFI